MQSPGSRTNCVGVTTRLSATTERPDRVREITQVEFDQLATFVAVAEELRMEPFLSEDNHERLVQLRAAWGIQRQRPFLPSGVPKIGNNALSKAVARF